MNNQEQSLCFFWHRSEKLPCNKEKLVNLKLRIYEKVDKAIESGDYIFYFGACYGVDLLCADIILKRKRIVKISDPKDIKLIAVVPFGEQPKKWNEENREI